LKALNFPKVVLPTHWDNWERPITGPAEDARARFGDAGRGFIEQHAVTSFHWLTAQQFLDGLALGQLTPGPVVISTCHPELAAAGGGSAFRFGRNIRTWEDSK
jgi:hypothetical protein